MAKCSEKKKEKKTETLPRFLFILYCNPYHLNYREAQNCCKWKFNPIRSCLSLSNIDGVVPFIWHCLTKYSMKYCGNHRLFSSCDVIRPCLWPKKKRSLDFGTVKGPFIQNPLSLPNITTYFVSCFQNIVNTTVSSDSSFIRFVFIESVFYFLKFFSFSWWSQQSWKLKRQFS